MPALSSPPTRPLSRSLACRLAPWLLATLASLLGACGTPAALPRPELAPEGASGLHAKPGWQTQRTAVAAAHPLAAQAGLAVLRDGGSAVDAAVAVQMVLGLVEPQSSGLGGGAFLLHFDGQAVQAYDGRETAPAAADETLFLLPDGQPMPFAQAMVSGRAVGVPGAVAMLALAHRQHGQLPWARLLAPAIALAETGFPVSPRLHTLLAADPHLRQDPQAAALYYDASGQPWPVGHVLKNPALAQALRALATQGARALHEGPLAQALVDKVRSHPTHPGSLSLADLAGYQPRVRQALCHAHAAPPQRVLRICGFPPPSSGGIAVGQILGLLQHTPAAALPLDANGLPGADWLHYYSEAARLAFADRALYLADPDFLAAPAGSWASLLAPGYLAERARLIGPRSMQVAPAGRPAGSLTSLAPMPAQPEFGTSHISIVDAQGRSVAMTSTVEAAFGTRQMVSGFLLNNQLTDFSFVPRDAQGRPVANRVQPGKRPRSSMAPTLVFDAASGQLLASAGSPGGALIIHYTAKTLWGMLHWGLNAQQAIDLPNFGSLNGPTLLEAQRFPSTTVQALQARGHTVQEIPMTSGIQAIQRTPGGYFGGADPRREGVVLGD